MTVSRAMWLFVGWLGLVSSWLAAGSEPAWWLAFVEGCVVGSVVGWRRD